MTDHRAHDHYDQAVSDRLARHQHTLANSLDDVLDIEAGLREVLIHSRHDTTVDNLDTVLDTEAGLAAILPTTPQPATPATPATTHDPVDAEELLSAVSPADRMTLRNDPHVKTVSRKLAPGHSLGHTRNHRTLRRSLSRALTRALSLAQDLSRISARRSVFNPVRARHLTRTLDRAIAVSLDLALDLALDLDHVLLSGLDRHRVRDLHRIMAGALNLDHVLDRDHALDLDRARARARDLALALSFDFDFAPAAIIDIRTKEVCRAIGLVLRQQPPVLDTASVRTVLDDFTKDDLRTADLTDIDLSGVRWSRHTQWPPTMNVDNLKARSDETPSGSGTWIVRSGTATIRNLSELG
ncbi:hypothetical protein [Streptomyces sp. NBC_01334]|uniref:hypothetical protein n=1 Tax=Streptomyces sp. NBC_01334 TaxID=2903827 RepID=UPI002E11F0DD|nr:hypothetical protein OG736_46895 [Streptomyces sp. NBC_01334]